MCQFLIAVIVAVLIAPIYFGAAEPPTEKRLAARVEQSADAVTIKDPAGKALLRYQLTGGANEDLSVESGCYFHPFATPSGVTVTEVAPDDHRHHRGIFLAFVEMHGERDADFWGWGEHASTKNRVIVNQSVSVSPNKAQNFNANNDWIAEGKVMVRERLAAMFTQPNERVNVLDLHYTLTPAADTTLSQWSFSGFCVRTRKDAELTAFGPQGEVKLPNPSHLNPKSDWPAQPWYAFELRLNDGGTAGVSVIDHPKNPPTLWHNHRAVRMLNPSIVAPAAVKLRGGKPLVLRYRVVAYDGRTIPDELDRLASEFAKTK